MMDPTDRFSTRVDNYIAYRPRYPHEIVATLEEECCLTRASLVADIGSGTGALAELFLQHGNTVFAVEPNRNMREAAERLLHRYPGFRSVVGRAEATALGDASVDIVVVGQAFHWFDVASARQEFQRVLKPPGWVMVVWNERDYESTPFLAAYDQLLRKYGIDYARVRHKSVYDTGLGKMYGAGGHVEKDFHYRQNLDFEGVKGRLLSSSYTPEPGHPNHEPMVAELSKIYSANAVDGRVTFEYITRMYLGCLRAEIDWAVT